MRVRLWQARVDGGAIYLGGPGVSEALWYTHAGDIVEVSLSFTQNGDPAVAIADEVGDRYLRFFDPIPSAVVNLALDVDVVNPRITLDDDRAFNSGNSDIVLGYVRGGVLRYRLQRDRFLTEYTPPIGEGGAPASAAGLRHISMNSKLRLEFLTDTGGDQDWTLPRVIEDVCQRANLDEERLRLSGLDWARRVRGYTSGGAYQGAGILQTLSGVFFFDPANANGMVAFVPRGADAVDTILDADMIAPAKTTKPA